MFVHGITGDGDLDWRALLPHMTDRFTCHLPSYRGRGPAAIIPTCATAGWSTTSSRTSAAIGEPTGLVGWSAGADLALVAAGTRSDAVDAVAPVEPVMPRLFDEQDRAAFGRAIAGTGELAAGGRLTDAMRRFADVVFTDGDIAVAEDAGYFEAAGRYAPHLLGLLRQWGEGGPASDDPAVLGAISAPVLVLRGSDTRPYAEAAARHVADHARDARVRAIPGAGHASPFSHPEELADALTKFFTRAREPA